MTPVTPEPAFVLLHGFGTSSREWAHVAERAGVQVLHPDLPGFGSARDQPAVGIEGMADHVLDAVQRAGLQRYVLVGRGLGARVALGAAARRPPGLEGVAMVAPPPLAGDVLPPAIRERLRGAYGNPDALRAYHRDLARADLQDADLERLVQDGVRASREAWTHWLEVGSHEDVSANARDVNVPVLLLVADEDPVAPGVEAEAAMREHLPGLTCRSNRDAGHLLPLEQPIWVTRELLHWGQGLHA